MRQLIVGKSLAFGAGIVNPSTTDNIQNLTLGAISASRSDTGELLGNGITRFTSPFTKDTLITFHGKTSTDVVHNSAPVCPISLNWVKTAYDAPVAKVCHVGRNNTGTIANWAIGNIADNVGRFASIRVYDLSVAEGVTNNQYVATYKVKEGDVELNVFNGLYDELKKFEGKVFASVTKTVNANKYGYAFVGIVGKNFRVHAEDIIESSVISVQTKIKFGEGLASRLAFVEKDFSTHKGFNNTNWLQNELYLQSSDVDNLTNYDIYALTWNKPNFQIIAEGASPIVQHLLIAVPTGIAVSTSIENLLIHISSLGVIPAPI